MTVAGRRRCLWPDGASGKTPGLISGSNGLTLYEGRHAARGRVEFRSEPPVVL